MKFEVTSNIQYTVKNQTTFLFNISASKTSSQTILEEALHIEPYILAEELYLKEGQKRSIRLKSNETGSLKINYRALVNLEIEFFDKEQLNQVPIEELPADIITYLFPSRYCQSDKLIRLAQNKFGHIENSYELVCSICDWIYKNIAYISGSTGSETSALDTVTDREGVCRDFAHLGITLCRALTIPARYFSCYAYNLQPPDFHACFEAYLGGKWIIFDPTGLAPLNGLIRIGTGRDATDIAVSTYFGNVEFKSMDVLNQVQEQNFKPFYLKDLQERGICLD
jgi:transglutaminase-like putative cysteine protease